MDYWSIIDLLHQKMLKACCFRFHFMNKWKSCSPSNLLVLSNFFLLVSISKILVDYDTCFGCRLVLSTDYGVLRLLSDHYRALLYPTKILCADLFSNSPIGLQTCNYIIVSHLFILKLHNILNFYGGFIYALIVTSLFQVNYLFKFRFKITANISNEEQNIISTLISLIKD